MMGLITRYTTMKGLKTSDLVCYNSSLCWVLTFLVIHEYVGEIL